MIYICALSCLLHALQFCQVIPQKKKKTFETSHPSNLQFMPAFRPTLLSAGAQGGNSSRHKNEGDSLSRRGS